MRVAIYDEGRCRWSREEGYEWMVSIPAGTEFLYPDESTAYGWPPEHRQVALIKRTIDLRKQEISLFVQDAYEYLASQERHTS